MMKKQVVALSVALVAMAGSAHAHTIVQLEQKVARYASPYPGVYKQPCVCVGADPSGARTGVLRYAIAVPNLGQRRLRVWCDALSFAPGGTPSVVQECDTFLPLAK